MGADLATAIEALARRLHPPLREALAPTPLELIGLGPSRFHAKREDLQETGSFKVRGALAKLRSLEPKELRSGVVCASAGNHGKGVAWAARRLGIPAAVVV